jgi:hypothetical protein
MEGDDHPQIWIISFDGVIALSSSRVHLFCLLYRLDYGDRTPNAPLYSLTYSHWSCVLFGRHFDATHLTNVGRIAELFQVYF